MTNEAHRRSLISEASDVYGNWPLEVALYLVIWLTTSSTAMVLNIQFEVSVSKAVLYTAPLVPILLLLLPVAYAAYRRSVRSKTAIRNSAKR